MCVAITKSSHLSMPGTVHALACRSSRRDGERSGKRKRHHAEHAEHAEAALPEPASSVPVTDPRLDLEATAEVVSPSKRVKHVQVQARVSLACLALTPSQPGCLWQTYIP